MQNILGGFFGTNLFTDLLIIMILKKVAMAESGLLSGIAGPRVLRSSQKR
ncbi:MAG: hypothetical protein WGN25_06920 [Candidatus Electrothrix sp. GW3-4]